jgi:hypothetical protein
MIDVQQESQFNQPVEDKPEFIGNSDEPFVNDDSDLVDGGGGDGDDGNNLPPDDPNADNNDYGLGGKPIDSNDSEEKEGVKKDIPPFTKGLGSKKTAKMIAKAYQQFMPVFPRMIAQMPETKLNKLSMQGKLDLNFEFTLDGRNYTTIISHFRTYNKAVDEQIVITDEMRDEFQYALQDVLMEKKVELTPTQRLGVVVAVQLGTMCMQAAGFKAQQNNILKELIKQNASRSRGKSEESPESVEAEVVE